MSLIPITVGKEGTFYYYFYNAKVVSLKKSYNTANVVYFFNQS
jgi:hypothetical protein